MVSYSSEGGITGDMGDFIKMIFRPPQVNRRKGQNNNTLDAVKMLEHFDNTSYSRVSTQERTRENLTKITDKAFLQLGRLRSMCREMTEFNETFDASSGPSALATFCRFRVVELLSNFELVSTEPVKLGDLHTLIDCMERHFAAQQRHSRDNIAHNRVAFADLHELYKPGTEVIGPAGGLTQDMAYLVRSCHYEETSTQSGTKREFNLELEFFASVGDRFSAIRFQENMGSYPATRPLSQLDFKVMSESARENLTMRGDFYSDIARGQNFLSCKGGCFLSGNVRNMGNAGESRVMVDVETAMDHGQAPILAGNADAGPEQLKFVAQKYQKARSDGLLEKKAANVIKDDTGILVVDRFVFFDAVPPERTWNCWPTVPAYDVILKMWGHVEVNGLSQIQWQENAWGALVLPPDRKELIKAVVTKQNEVESIDIIEGKGEGTTFLLYGPPGTGKTLTAEAMAEQLHKPLYVLSAGEMGTTPKELESTFKSALQLCSKWDCLCLVDEADIFLEKRAGNDVLRNALVCVMLRQLEYHTGILFLTTNKAKGIDPAVRSRLTLALRYDSLDQEGRRQVWENLLTFLDGAGPFDYDELSNEELNGRDIKNAVRLSMALALEANEPLCQAMVLDTLETIRAFREELNQPKEGGRPGDNY